MILAKQKVNQLPQQTPKATPTKRVRKVTRTRVNPRAVYVLIFVIAFLVGIFFTSRYAQLAVTGYQVNQIKEKMQGLELENQKLSVQVDGLKSLNRIETVAMTELGMVKPEGVQFISVEDKASSKNSVPVESAKGTSAVKSQATVAAGAVKDDTLLANLAHMLTKAKVAAKTATAGE